MIKTRLAALFLVLATGLPLSALAGPAMQKEAKAPAASATIVPPADRDTAALVSINSATAQELVAALNGIGMKKAESIISYREKYGPFSQLEQLKEVPGIGNMLVESNLSRMKL